MSDKKLIEDLQDALCRALPFVEDAQGSEEYKPAYVKAIAKLVRQAVEKAEKAIHENTTH